MMTTQTEPGDTSEPPKDSVDELHANATGVWAVRSTSTTVYYLDLDRRRLLRLRGVGSPAGPYDGCWVPLVSFATLGGEHEVVRVGARNEFLTDPDGWAASYRFWIPRMCSRIDRVDRDVADALSESD
ncbi:hypothetical protein [Cellulomonas chitinilytica]|nr:hypothetical protein [Cellulomonas chitinilytica]